MTGVAPKRTNGQREADLEFVAARYLQGWTHAAIRNALNADYQARGFTGFTISRQQVTYDIKKLTKRWLKSQLINIDKAKSRELARIDKLEEQAWDAWERSKLNAETTIEQTGGKFGPSTTQRTEGQVGNPAYLATVLKCVETRIKILGLEQSGEIIISSGARPIPVKQVLIEFQDAGAE